jgi:hypothetical protein
LQKLTDPDSGLRLSTFSSPHLKQPRFALLLELVAVKGVVVAFVGKQFLVGAAFLIVNLIPFFDLVMDTAPMTI